jgi:hypothetical protein
MPWVLRRKRMYLPRSSVRHNRATLRIRVWYPEHASPGLQARTTRGRASEPAKQPARPYEARRQLRAPPHQAELVRTVRRRGLPHLPDAPALTVGMRQRLASQPWSCATASTQRDHFKERGLIEATRLTAFAPDYEVGQVSAGMRYKKAAMCAPGIYTKAAFAPHGDGIGYAQSRRRKNVDGKKRQRR